MAKKLQIRVLFDVSDHKIFGFETTSSLFKSAVEHIQELEYIISINKSRAVSADTYTGKRASLNTSDVMAKK